MRQLPLGLLLSVCFTSVHRYLPTAGYLHRLLPTAERLHQVAHMFVFVRVI